MLSLWLSHSCLKVPTWRWQVVFVLLVGVRSEQRAAEFIQDSDLEFEDRCAAGEFSLFVQF